MIPIKWYTQDQGRHFDIRGNVISVGPPYNDQWLGALMFSLICAWTNGWENNRDAGDLRRQDDHCDVIVV